MFTTNYSKHSRYLSEIKGINCVCAKILVQPKYEKPF